MIIGKNIDLRPIEISDAEFVLSLRLNPELGQFLSPVENNITKQREWINLCTKDSQQKYFIIQNKRKEAVGTIRIYDIKDNHFCWGSWIVKPEARSYATFESIVLLYEYAFFELGFDYTDFDVRKKNETALNFYLRFGAVTTTESDQDFFLNYKKTDFIKKYEEYKAVINKIHLTTLPLVSIIITTYNHEKCIENAIESALAQDYTHTEIIISDDASTDNTLKIATRYADKYPSKIKLLTANKNRGVTENWFKAVAHCTGHYITVVAGDDSIPPQKVSKQITVMESDPDIAICYTDASVFDVHAQKEIYRFSNKSPTKSGDVKTGLADSIYYSPTLMFQRKFAPTQNIFSGIKHASDLAYFKEVMILSAPKGKIYYLPEVLFTYNKHASNLTVVRYNENYKEHIKAIKILQKTYPEYKRDLDPSISDFCCVGFFKNSARFRFKEAFYFLQEGLQAAHYNPFKFLRPLVWAMKFLYQTHCNDKP